MATNLVIVVGILLFFALIFWSISQTGTTSATRSREFASRLDEATRLHREAIQSADAMHSEAMALSSEVHAKLGEAVAVQRSLVGLLEEMVELQRQANQHLGRIAGGSSD